jgi:phosphoribosylformimino-5-aminoimidazole carboxamide ribotide isomerase
VTLFKPCIDLHAGKVKQIVGGSLRDDGTAPKVNFSSLEPASHYASLYRQDELYGGHVILLGPGNDAAALDALGAWPGGLQLGGGVNPENAERWLAAGAAKVIVTSYLFEDKKLSQQRLARLAERVAPEQLVIDLSCRRRADGWFVATDRWQVVTETRIERSTLEHLASYASEFLIHAADVEGLCQGIDEELVALLGKDCPIPCTYAGGGRVIEDLQRVADLSRGRVDLTFGSALDLFGGTGVRYADCVAFNRRQRSLAT